MSYRIHRAIGWGMAWNDFEATTIIDCEAHETWDNLEEIMSVATDEILTVPMEERRETRNARGIPSIFDNRILALNMEFDHEAGPDENGYVRRIPPALGSPDDLWKTISDGDDIAAVLFAPNALLGRQWHRYANDLDYVFEAFRDGPLGDAEPRDFLYFAKFGHYPYSNYLMDKDGNPLEWETFHRLDKTYPQGWYPAVPSEIRWYLKRLGIMDDAGVNKLRPIVAQWWC